MKWILIVCFFMSSAPLDSHAAPAAVSDAESPLAHVSSTFSFQVIAGLRDAAPLFGPEGERAWAGTDWNPQFVFPTPAKDVQGAVFTLRHGEHTAIWITTVYDVEAGHMQYVYVLADLLATTIDVRLHTIDPTHTKVDVTYTRTALRPEATEHVLHMGKHDGEQGPQWETAINAYLRDRTRSR